MAKRINGALSKSEDAVDANNCDLNIEENIDKDGEGINLDMSILESQLLNATSIGSPQMKLKKLEGVFRLEDDVICKLSEDNLILRSKLSSIANLTPKDHIHAL